MFVSWIVATKDLLVSSSYHFKQINMVFPLPLAFDKDALEDKMAVMSDEVLALTRSWYQFDANSIPPHHTQPTAPARSRFLGNCPAGTYEGVVW
jgi:hypothetical protein